jgi:hypothetical protein
MYRAPAVLIVKPPTPIPDRPGARYVFLAGSIEQGKAIDWQTAIEQQLDDIEDLVVLNPRRDDWDASWTQSIDDPQFRGQVEWELDGMERADVVAMYFAAGTKSPITLLELGLNASTDKLVVTCPDGFWRKGNVDVVCARYGIDQAPDLDALVAAIRLRLNADRADDRAE